MSDDEARKQYIIVELEILLALAAELSGCQQDELQLGHVRALEQLALSVFKKGEMYIHEVPTQKLKPFKEDIYNSMPDPSESGTMPLVNKLGYRDAKKRF
jgi:hypothetical protein